ncbi:MAG: MlaE family ABC transporter permease [Candidatus Cyclobacteriaceae bacterium M3_2C_046]
MPATKDTKEKSPKSDSFFNKIPSDLNESFITIAGITRFSGKFFQQFYKPPYEFNEILRQAFRLGYKSLFLVGLSGFIIGLVMTLQTKPTMKDFGAESFIPSMISVSIIREIGPVLTALICAGKIGSGIGAELGSMKVTEQIDSMTVSGINPFNFLVVTRVLATTIMIPLLVIYADSIAMVGSYLGMNLGGEVSMRLFISQAMAPITYVDVLPSLAKSVLFGFAIGIVGCYKGYNSKGGTVGVGNAANSAVVVASLMIFIIDLLAVQIKQLFI